MRRRKIESDIRETVIYKDERDQLAETNGYIIENPKEPSFLYIHRKLVIETGLLAETIAINKHRLVKREREA